MEESRENTPVEASNWDRVVDLIQTASREGQLTEEAMWQVVVLITKDKKDYCFISLVELMWKLVTAILNCRLIASITFHKSNDTVVLFTLGNQDHHLPHGLLRKLPLPGRRLN